MAGGLPAVSFDCPSGPRDIIRHEFDGLLVPPEDPAALAKALRRLMSHEAERKMFGQRARQVVDRFSTEVFYRRWDAVLRGDEPAAATDSA